jgi:hypothetical protein
MDIDHIFIFTDTNGRVADELISFGLTPNDSRSHPGQGTSNRTFTFTNFYLEIAWVHNVKEIKSKLVKPTGLWQRAEYFKNNFSPFGIIFSDKESASSLFTNAYKYQPNYFSRGTTFDIVKNENYPDLPWMCRLPPGNESKTTPEKVKHRAGIKTLTSAGFEYSKSTPKDLLTHFTTFNKLQFIKSDKEWLTLEFDNNIQQLSMTFESLCLTVNY